MPTPLTEAFFLPVDYGRGGQRFCLFHHAHGRQPLGSVLHVHPFAEEMNKARRMAALQSRALAQAGYAVLQIDLLGCGDSSGDFGDASWQDWVTDVVLGCQWLRARSDTALWLWGLRVGCLLATDAARQLNETCNFIFMAPSTSGKLQLHQFLRLKAAAGFLNGTSKGVTDELRQKLANGSAVEVAGYTVSPELAIGMENSELTPPRVLPASAAPRMEWFDLSAREDPRTSPITADAIAKWDLAGYATRNHLVHGPSFWQTTEIEDAPHLVSATIAALSTLPQSLTAAA